MSETINVMEAIWQSSEKAEDGCLYYPIEFIDFLWDHGFVDGQQYPKETWRRAFEPFKQADGNYKISHDEFLTLDKYRYLGEIHIPFDAMRINEGKYTDEGFGELVRDSIGPSCSLAAEPFKKFIEDLKEEYRQADSLILIKPDAKLKIKKLLEDYPSPLHRLELLFDQLLKKTGIEEELATTEKKIARVATPSEQASVQQSTFLSGEATFSELQAKKLKQIAKAKLPEAGPTEGEPLKKVKRSKKGLRG